MAPQQSASTAKLPNCSCSFVEDRDRLLDDDRGDGDRADRHALPPDSLDLLRESDNETELTLRETLSTLGFVGTGEDEPGARVSRRAVFGRVAPPRSSVAPSFWGRAFKVGSIYSDRLNRSHLVLLYSLSASFAMIPDTHILFSHNTQ